ncbi:hypothetical protein CDV36_010103 [Fusarium kuroshium]|uniref:Heterokaryon incompatibility domain-containing protein n=1 Tax=Fusarium kuroshium TaxID=2010991 RepID=A0A3M2RY84_9HYPO|nr:hypothetical protein CDV36_010103 [Fusarium kuroshium]
MDSPSTLDTGDNNEQIYHSAVNCDALFKQLLTQSAQSNGQNYATLRDHHLRFERWVEFVGALADEQASLDDRLKPYPEVQDLVLQMLQMLDSNLCHVRFQLKENRGAKPVYDAIDDSQPKAQIEAHRTVELIPAEGPPTTRMTNNLPAALAVEAALKAVQEAIDRLQRLGTMIRRSSTVTIASRVKNYAFKADAAENDEFNKLILLRVKGILPGISESLAIQLLESISHRRLRLLYQQRHQRKLERQRPGRSNQSLSREPEMENQKSDPPPQPVISKSSQRKAAGMASVYSKSQPESGTAHSTFDLAAFQNYQSQEDSVPPDNITVTSVAQGYSYPRPPRPQEGSKHIRCDWCFEEITDSQLQKPGWWRSHFKKDLQPYVCISEDCIDPPVYFTSFLLWRKHMEQFHTADWARRIHSPSVWYCDLDPDGYQEFESADQLREHLTSRHTIATEVQLARRLSRSVLPSPRKESICPLCNQNVSKIHDPMIESKVKGKETLRFAKRPKKARFGDLADSLGSEEEASSRQPNHLVEPELGTDDTMAVERQKLAIHVASHLKALSFLSIRYMESDSESVKSEDAALGIDNDASDQDRLSDIFPLSDGPLDFQDIPLDDRPANDEGPNDQDASLNFLESSPVPSPDLSSFSPLVDGLADAEDDVDPVDDLTASNVLRPRLESTGSPRPLFVSANINQLQSGFLLDQLSPTIQDAVAVTKYLGIQFLWVDSMCIIQDDPEDWELESMSVTKVYRNAYCTIAATSAPGQDDGFLNPRLRRKFVSINTPAKITVSLCELIDDFEEEVDGGPLNQRAWAFQERLLSRRIIHFARNQFYWQCGDGIRCETFTKLSHPLDVLFGDPDFPRECLRKIHPQFRVPQILYELFSRLKVTRHSDRTHAIAEIERLLAIKTERSASYGVFGGSGMARWLLWKHADDEASLIPINDGKPIPKWSWMAYSGAIAYLNVPADELGVRWAGVVFGESNDPTHVPILVRGHLVVPGQTIKAYFDEPNETVIRAKGKEERRIVLATYEPEDGEDVREYILIVELFDDDHHGEHWRRVGVGEYEHPKTMETNRESTSIILI